MRVTFAKHASIAAAGAALALSAPLSAAEISYQPPARHYEYAGEIPFGDLTARHDRKYKHRYRNGYEDGYYYGGRYHGARRYRSHGDPVYHDTRIWRGRDGRYFCRRRNGTTGLLIGAGLGGLIGNEAAGRDDKGAAVLLGAVGGAILGREIDRSNARCR